ncbi:hypothetical protein BZA77DRAFT_353811 [Pyronema omphalodes]|nr:hypothetical protein BZA77DRAFT_353811 [Pyronema omphalodes]
MGMLGAVLIPVAGAVTAGAAAVAAIAENEGDVERVVSIDGTPVGNWWGILWSDHGKGL